MSATVALALLAVAALEIGGDAGAAELPETGAPVAVEPAPPVEAPAVEPPAVDAPALPDTPHGRRGAAEREGHDGKGGDEPRDDRFAPVLVGSGIGCGAGGALPATGAGVGLGVFYSSLVAGNACGDVAGLIGGVSGALVAIPSLLLLGPCAGGGAACGAVIGALVDGKDATTAALWTLPGVGAGVVGGIAATAGLLLTSSPEASLRGIAMPVGTTLVVVGTLASLAAGPLAVAGATLTQRPSDSEDEDEKPALRDGGLQARAPAMGSAATAAMRF